MHEFAYSRARELEARALEIEYRRQWYELQELEKLEEAASRARAQFASGPILTTR